MPKIDAPDVKKGFWLTVGVVIALLLFSMVQMLLHGARRRAAA